MRLTSRLMAAHVSGVLNNCSCIYFWSASTRPPNIKAEQQYTAGCRTCVYVHVSYGLHVISPYSRSFSRPRIELHLHIHVNLSCSAPSCFPKRQTHEEYREFMGLVGKKEKICQCFYCSCDLQVAECFEKYILLL